MKHANNPDLAIAQEWLKRLRAWLQSQDLEAALQHTHKQIAPGTSFLRYCFFTPRSAVEAGNASSVLPLQACLVEAALYLNDIESATETVAEAEQAFATLRTQVEESPFLIQAPGPEGEESVALLTDHLSAWQALLLGRQLGGPGADACVDLLTRLREQALACCEPQLARTHPLTALRMAACLADTAQCLAPDKADDCEQLIAEYLPANAEILFKAHSPNEPPRLYRELLALDAMHRVSQSYPALISRDTMRSEIQVLLKQTPKNGVPTLTGGKGPVTLRDAAAMVAVFSRLGEVYSELRNKAIAPMRWASFYLQNPASGAPYAYRFRWRSVQSPAPIGDSASMYRALAAYLRYHHARLSNSIGNAYEG